MTSDPKTRLLARLADFLALRASLAGLLATVVLIGMGERLCDRFQSVYLLALGAAVVVPGYLNGATNILGALYAFPGGWVATRFGYRRALLGFNLVALAGYLIAAIAPHWALVIVGVLLFQAWSAISMPATMDLIATALPSKKRTMGVTMHSLVRRIPMALGPLAGGVLIDRYGLVEGARIAFAGACVLALLAIVVQRRFIREDERARSAPLRLREVPELIPPALRTLLAADILVRFCEQLPFAYVVVWLMQHPDGARVSATQVGVLTTIEMATALLVYVPVAWWADKSGKKPLVVITYGFFTAFPLLLLGARSLPWLVVAFAVRGLKEFGEPTRKALILDLAPEGRKAAAFGAYYLLRDCVVGVVALAAGWLWRCGPAANFVVAAVCGLAGTLVLVVWGRDPER
ncbi:MAG TPA: MFS transporter [Opitutaceae bacterium]|nr:MFS transporter [Opitutaceae bacterium]